VADAAQLHGTEQFELLDLKFVVCGGSAMPRPMIKAFVDKGVEVRHAWGMTEMSPLGTVGALKPPFAKLTGEEKLDVLQLQGYPPFGVQMKITGDAGKELPWDGKTFGQLKVAGPAVSKAYYRVDSKILDDDGVIVGSPNDRFAPTAAVP
jgi:fatty-acyl-CoA synthase